MKNRINLLFIICLIIDIAACSPEIEKSTETSEFIYYGGQNNPDAEITINNRDYARRAYFYCENCVDNYTNRYLEDGIWLWDQKTCRQKDSVVSSNSLYCLRDVLVGNFSVEYEAYTFSDAGCDFIIPKIGDPEFPGSEKVQICETNDNISSDAVYCAHIHVALDQKETCVFSDIDEEL